jgi:hypothetical protein
MHLNNVFRKLAWKLKKKCISAPWRSLQNCRKLDKYVVAFFTIYTAKMSPTGQPCSLPCVLPHHHLSPFFHLEKKPCNRNVIYRTNTGMRTILLHGAYKYSIQENCLFYMVLLYFQCSECCTLLTSREIVLNCTLRIWAISWSTTL